MMRAIANSFVFEKQDGSGTNRPPGDLASVAWKLARAGNTSMTGRE
jgi:hypothetical protein